MKPKFRQLFLRCIKTPQSVFGHHVLLQLMSVLKLLLTVWTMEGLGPMMLQHVYFHVTSMGGSVRTVRAGIGLLSSVPTHVDIEITAVCSPVRTMHAGKRFFTRVSAHVGFEVIGRGCCVRTDRTLVRLIPNVHRFVLSMFLTRRRSITIHGPPFWHVVSLRCVDLVGLFQKTIAFGV